MATLVLWGGGLGLACYAIVGLYLLERWLGKHPPKRLIVLGLFGLGAAAHGVALLPSILTPFGLNFNLFNSLSLIAWFFVLFFVGFGLYRPILILGLLASPTAMIGAGAGMFGKAPYRPLSDIGWLLESHILLSLAAYCVLLMACVQALILTLQIQELKHPDRLKLWTEQLPPLQTMEGLLFDMLLFGFVLLSFALNFGFLATYDIKAQHLAHKLLFSVLSWLIFGGLIAGHYRYGWQGLRACRMTFYGYVLLALGFIGSKVILMLLGKS